MNAERLLALYDRVAEAPDAVPRLRCFLLDLAVRGRLIQQDPTDEPAAELLKRFAAEKARLEKSGELKGRKHSNTAPPSGLDFSLRSGWAAARLSDVLIEMQTGPFGSSLHQRDYEIGGTPVINPTSIQEGKIVPIEKMAVGGTTLERLSTFKLRKGDIVIGRRGEMGRCAVVTDQEDGWLCGTGSLILRLPTDCYAEYLVLLIGSPLTREYLSGSSVGATMRNLNQSILFGMSIGVPPLAEQNRIVAKVDELMALCDQLEETRARREDTRDRLIKTSFARLTRPDTDGETFRAHAGFAIDSLPALTVRVDQVKQLRQTILNLAVRGKLVDQNPADEPLSCLDTKIPPEFEPPFELPQNWRWSRLRALGALRGGGTPSKDRADFWNGAIPWVSPKDMKSDYIAATQMRVTEAAIEDSPVNLIEPQGILFVVRGMILEHSFPVAISRVPLTINQDMKAINLKIPEMAEYTLRALKGMRSEMLARVQRSSHGTCRIAGTDYGDFMIPLPPIAEQGRIVASVDGLMALCDRLETSLGIANTGRQRLLDSLVRDALVPERTKAHSGDRTLAITDR